MTFLTKVHIVKTMFFSVIMYRCEFWTIKEAEHQRIDAFKLWCYRRVLHSFDCKEIKPVNQHRNQPWILLGRTDGDAETLILWLPDEKDWLIGKFPDTGKDWRWEEKGMTGWDGWMASPTRWTWVLASSRSWWWMGSLACCSPSGLKESDTTEQLTLSLYFFFKIL